MKKIEAAVAAAMLVGLAGCVTAANMELPRFAVATERFDMTGMGWGSSGSFQAGPYVGRFTRVETRLDIAGALFASDRGRSSFVVEGTDLIGRVQASCGMIRNTVNLSVAAYQVSPMVYRCSFAMDGQPLNADFILEDAVDQMKRVDIIEERRGQVWLNDTVLTVRSTNHIQGSALPSETPIGYTFDLDGRPVGAIELNGTEPTVWLPLGVDADLRGAAILAALSLAVFQDPADSALGD